MKKSIIRTLLPAIILMIGICAAMPQSASGAGLLKLWLEAQVEDGQESVWKIYLYGAESDGQGEMTCTFGNKKYEGTWTTSTTQGKTAYIFTFPETEAPQFTMHNGNTIRLDSSAIVMTGSYEGDFAVDTDMGQCVPFGTATGGVVRETFDCEILD